jgi:hypothetical protein
MMVDSTASRYIQLSVLLGLTLVGYVQGMCTYPYVARPLWEQMNRTFQAKRNVSLARFSLFFTAVILLYSMCSPSLQPRLS